MRHRRTSGKLLVVAVALVALGGCADEGRELRARGTHPGEGHDAPRATRAKASELSDANIVALLAVANRSDIEGGKLAQEKASATPVREFGRRMINDHSALLARGTEWSKQTVTNPDQPARGEMMVRDHQQAMERLRDKYGEEFDRAYIEHEIEAHEKVINLVNQAQATADDPKLRRILQESKPVLQDHLEQARMIQRML